MPSILGWKRIRFPLFLSAAIGFLIGFGWTSGPLSAMSFFIGQADEIPKPLRFMPLLVVPPLAALGTMLYWIWRVRIARNLRGLALRQAGVA